jgi:hypothetical protein
LLQTNKREGDINGDGRNDFHIELTGLKTLTAADFILYWCRIPLPSQVFSLSRRCHFGVLNQAAIEIGWHRNGPVAGG